MEPRIQYAQTSDGVSIAYSTMGAGRPLVNVQAHYSHLQFQWQVPQYRRWLEGLAEKRMVVRYDPRGSGLSDRDAPLFSLDTFLLDLAAVVDALRLERFALLGYLSAGPPAIAYAARHPERVSHLILYCSSARGSDLFALPRDRALGRLREADWDSYTETAAYLSVGPSDAELAPVMAAYIRESITPETMQSVARATNGIDVVDVLPQVKAPTLVLHRRQLASPTMNVAKGLASRIFGARLVLLEGTSALPYIGDAEAAVRAIDEFLTEGEEAAGDEAPADVRTILFTDLTGSSALGQRLGDAKAQEVRRAHNAIVRDALQASGGREIKHTGDGIMASFASASGALECAGAIQRGVAEHDDANLQVHVGLNAGEPIAEERDLFGTSVDLARRICDHAEAGQILASNVVRELAAGKDFLFSDRGEQALRGFEDPVRLYELAWRERG